MMTPSDKMVGGWAKYSRKIFTFGVFWYLYATKGQEPPISTPAEVAEIVNRMLNF
jgi:hypothetical protein